jgi:hypothetical protein
MRSKFLKCAAIVSLGVCSLVAPVAKAAGPKKGKAPAASKAADANAKKPLELHADDKSMKKQMGWEDKVMGPDDKRAELEKIARANAINEKAAKEREKQAALEAAAPAPKAAPTPSRKNELAIPQTAEEKALNDSDRGKSHEISPKLASEAAQAPVPAAKPADDKFIDKLLKEESGPSRKRAASANDRELDALLNDAKEKPAGRKHKGDAVDDMIKTADKGPAMPAPRSPASQPDWMKQPEIGSTPAAASPPPPPPVAVKPAPKKDDGVIHVVQGAAVQPAAAPTPPPAPVASRTINGRGKKGAPKAAPAPVNWNDPFADKKPVASRDSRDEEATAPPPRKAPASRPAAATPAAWNDPFADSPEPRRTTRRTPAPTPAPAPAPAATKRGEKSDPSAHPAGWKDPFTKAPSEPTRAPVAMREPVKGESSKWEIAARRSPAAHAAETHATGWAVLKKRR